MQATRWSVIMTAPPLRGMSSWNAAHFSRGCSQDNLIGTGGNGYFYCFATD